MTTLTDTPASLRAVALERTALALTAPPREAATHRACATGLNYVADAMEREEDEMTVGERWDGLS